MIMNLKMFHKNFSFGRRNKMIYLFDSVSLFCLALAWLHVRHTKCSVIAAPSSALRPTVGRSIPSSITNGDSQLHICDLFCRTHLAGASNSAHNGHKTDEDSFAEEKAYEMVHWGGSRGIRWSSHHLQASQVLGRRGRPLNL